MAERDENRGLSGQPYGGRGSAAGIPARGRAGGGQTGRQTAPRESDGSRNGEREFRPRNGKVTFYHANGKGTGTAARFELRLNGVPESRANCFFLDMARQKTAAQGGRAERSAATFDWENKATVKLGFPDVCELLLVLEGRAEQAGGQRNGIYHETGKATTVIALRRNPERGGCFLGVSRKDKNGGPSFREQIALGDAECLGLRVVLAAGLARMALDTGTEMPSCAAGEINGEPPR